MSEANITVVFRLVGTPSDGGLVRLHEFNEFCQHVADVLKETERCISAGGKRTLQYRVADLQCKSALIQLEPVKPNRGKDRRAEVLDTVRSTCQRLQSGQKPDPRLSPRAIHAYKEMAKPIQRSIGKTVDQQHAIQVDGIELTSAFVVNIDKLSEKKVKSVGSFSGVLEQLNLRNKSEFAIFPPIGEHRIVCHFPENLFDIVRDGLKRHVTVYGAMYYVVGKPYPEHCEVKDIVVHPPHDELPTLSGLAGKLVLRGDSVSMVRALRDESSTPRVLRGHLCVLGPSETGVRQATRRHSGRCE